MLITAITAVGIVALIVVHEWGHFWAAKKFNLKVDEFGIGFPPRIWSKQRKSSPARPVPWASTPMSNRLIVFEGIDGAGKATQVKMLSLALLSRVKKGTTLSVPD